MPRSLPASPFLYPILDVALVGERNPVRLVEELAQGGAGLVQLRAKGLPDCRFLAWARDLRATARRCGMLFLVNDRPDVARIAEADGVHLGQDDLSPADARRLLGPEAIIGYSTHTLAQLEQGRREPVDYLAIGPIYPTASKAQPDPVVGPELIRAARSRCDRPLVAIGGITAARAREVVEAGADGVAVISALLGAPDLVAATLSLRQALGPVYHPAR